MNRFSRGTTARIGSKKTTGTILATPNPIRSDGYQGIGWTTISWTSTGTESVEVRIGAPDGPLFSRSEPSGCKPTGMWAQAGMVFYLQDVSGGKLLTPENTLATVEISFEVARDLYDISEDDISAVIRRHTGMLPGRIRLVPTHTASLVCEVSCPGRNFFFKALPRHGHGSTAVEGWFYEYMRSLGQPAPEVVAVDTSRELLPRDYIITEKVSGLSLEECMKSSPSRIPALLREVGRHLRIIHSVVLKGGGRIDAAALRGEGQVMGVHSTWSEAVQADTVWALDFIKAHRLLDRETAAGIDRVLESRGGLLAAAGATSRLLHGDFIPRHIIGDAEGIRINGIIDCEDARVGDPVFDLACFNLASDDTNMGDLIAGYDPDGAETQALRERLSLYGVVHALVGMRVCHEAGAHDLTAGLLNVFRSRLLAKRSIAL